MSLANDNYFFKLSPFDRWCFSHNACNLVKFIVERTALMKSQRDQGKIKETLASWNLRQNGNCDLDLCAVALVRVQHRPVFFVTLYNSIQPIEASPCEHWEFGQSWQSANEKWKLKFHTILQGKLSNYRIGRGFVLPASSVHSLYDFFQIVS